MSHDVPEATGGTSPLHPNNLEAYKTQYRQGVELFQQALKQYNHTEEEHKKAAFSEVMERALVLLNDTAKGLKRVDLLAYNQHIAKDLQDYQASGEARDEKQLEHDLQQAKKAL